MKADVSLLDDNFVISTTESKTRAKLIALELIKRGIDIRMWMMCGVRTFSVWNRADRELLELLRRAGVDRIFVGIESGSASSLRLFNKPTTIQESLALVRDLSYFGFSIHCTMILFHPYATLHELQTNLQFIRTLLAIPSVGMYTDLCSRLAVFPGTGLYHRLKEDGLIITSRPYLEPYPYRFLDDGVAFLSHNMMKLEPAFAELDWLVTDLRTSACRQGFVYSRSPEWRDMEDVITAIHKVKTDFFATALRCAESFDQKSFEDMAERTIADLSRLHCSLIRSSFVAFNTSSPIIASGVPTYLEGM